MFDDEELIAEPSMLTDEDSEPQESPWPEYDDWTDEAREEPVERDTTEEMPAWAQPTGALPYQPTADRPELTPSFREDPMPMNAPAMSASPLPRPSELPADAQPQARLPLPHQPKLAEIDPTLYEYWREHINQGFQRNNRMFDTILDAFMRPYNTTIWMYRILFGLGIAAFLVAAGLGAWLREPMFSLIFGGLSIVSFLTYFIGRPLQSLEENLKFITWLGIIYNTYWTRLVYSMDAESIHADLEDATQDAINEIERLLDKHHDFSGNRPGLR
ncbi:MAG: hypothetical protein R2873_09000 [Caldilineaceae bacterium]